MMLLSAFFLPSVIFGARWEVSAVGEALFCEFFSAGSLLIYIKFVYLLYVFCVVMYALERKILFCKSK